MNDIKKKARLFVTACLFTMTISCNKTQQAYQAVDAEYRTEVSQYGITWK